MSAAEITEDQALALFQGYLNVSQTDANNLVAYIFGTGDRTITGDLTVTGTVQANTAVKTNSIIQRTAAGLVVGAETDKLGFYGHATQTQQILATGAGKTADDIITFLQSTGLCKQA